MAIAIPKAAMPAVRVLRRDVPKPRTDSMIAPIFRGTECSARFPGIRCPLGLHPLARNCVPMYQGEFCEPILTTTQIIAFYRWWDSLTLTQAKQAVNLIWPKSARKRKGK